MKKTVSDPSIKFFISAIGLFIIFFVLMELRHIFIPFVIAYFLFFIYEPLNKLLLGRKIPLGLTVLINIIITVAVLWGVSRIIIDSFVQFGERLPFYETKLNLMISTAAKSLGVTNPDFLDFNISKMLGSFDYGGLATGLFTSTIDLFTNIFLILFFFIFISTGHDKIFEAIRMRYVEKEVQSSIKELKKEMIHKPGYKPDAERSLDEELATLTIQREIKLRKTFKDITEQVQKYIATKFLISLMLGIIVGLTTWGFGIEFFIIWATLSVLLNFIPNIGSVIAVLFISIMALLQFESFSYAFLVASTLILIQNIIGNIIEPKIFGDRLGLNPLVILLSLMLWGYLWGIVGMFLSVPLTAMFKIAISGSRSKNLRFIYNLMSN